MVSKILAGLLLLISMFSLSACSGVNYAPVIKPIIPVSKPGYYYVRPGDTLYSIAWAFGLDYKRLAQMNGIKDDQQIQPNQYLIINPAYVSKKISRSKVIKKINTVRTHTSVKIHEQHLKEVSVWRWPAKGQVIGEYAPWQGNKGINITGNLGEPIRAAASGIVVYAGSGLPAYGKLIILKNSRVYLSAYAYNQSIVVKEGQYVQQGQIIARMGRAPNRTKVLLHFEIRKYGKPINPLAVLK